MLCLGGGESRLPSRAGSSAWAPQLRGGASCGRGGGGGEPCKLPFPREGTLGTVYLLGLFVLPLRIPTARQKEAGGPSFLERDEGDVICVTTGQTTMQQVQEDELEGAFNGAG